MDPERQDVGIRGFIAPEVYLDFSALLGLMVSFFVRFLRFLIIPLFPTPLRVARVCPLHSEESQLNTQARRQDEFISFA